MEGFGKRLAANYADQAIGNMMSGGFFPGCCMRTPLSPSRPARAEPRNIGHGYAFSRIFVTRTDSGGTRFNYSEWRGNAAGVAISNLYQPDERDALDNVIKLLEQCATDGISQILKEFWPDIKHKLFHKNPPGCRLRRSRAGICRGVGIFDLRPCRSHHHRRDLDACENRDRGRQSAQYELDRRNGAPQHPTSKDCKIRKYGSNYISAAGNYHIQKAGFDVWEHGGGACASSMGFEILRSAI